MQITYNGYQINNVVNKISFSQNYTKAFFSCTFMILASSESELVSLCNDAEEKLSEWNKDFSLVFGEFSSTQEYSFSHDGNTGFLANPNIKLLADKEQSSTSRKYLFTLDVSLPARQDGFDFRQSANIVINAPLQARKTLTLTGTYTAGGGQSALENYNQFSGPWADSVAVSVFGEENFEKLDTNTKYEQENKVLDFAIRYQEKLSITVRYNNFAIPGSYYTFSNSQNYNGANFQVDFAILKSSVPSMLEQLTIKDQELQVTYGSNSISYNPSNNTGFLASPSVNKIDDLEENSDLEFYRFSVTLERPAEIDSDDYRRDGNFTLSFDGSRRKRVSFSVTYTAGGNNTALENYNDASNGAKAWATDILTNKLGFVVDSWEIINESTNTEQRDKILNGRFVAVEILSPETKSLFNDVDLQEVNCTYALDLTNRIGVTTTNSGFKQKKLSRINLGYSAKINRESVTSDIDLHVVYEQKVKPWIIEHSKNILAVNNIADASNIFIAMDDNYQIDPTNYTISGKIAFMAPDSENAIIFFQEKITDDLDEGRSFTPLWDGVDFTESVWNVGKRRSYTRAITVQKLGSPPPDPIELTGNFHRERFTKDFQVFQDGVGTIQFSNGQSVPIFAYSQNFFERYRYVETTEGNTILSPQQNEL